MTEQPNREVAVLNAALELRPAERAAYLDQACVGDPVLRQQVDALLQSHDQAESFLEAPPAGFDFKRTVRVNIPLTEKPGDKIGRYKLLQQIGEGGCGVVYMAEQEEPVRRRVALKVIKLGMDTKQVIARFEAERQALALMDHPNIAKIFDAGITDTPLPASDHPLPVGRGEGQGEGSAPLATRHSPLVTSPGRPFFVMELVRGIKITDFCDENQLSTEDRLKLFIQVCQAIQHAHQKGVIHRDIKPSNILVTINDDVPVPKVIDFGIAKATQGRLTDHTLFTAFEQFIGTPAYMSPEQAVMTSLDIDTRSDIYSLGVLLYELLTGRTPFDQKELLAAGLDEMRRTILEKEPPKPSTRLTQELVAAPRQSAADSGEENGGVLPRRRYRQIEELIHLLRGDLDCIVMKALEKDRARRYDTPSGLAMDILRHLNCEPVIARPPSRLYEFQKTVRRHKFGFAAAGALILVLAVGAVVSTLEAIRATRAEREQARQRQIAVTKEKKSEQVAQFLEDMLNGVEPSVALGRDTTLLREILDRTAERVGKNLKDQPEVEAELRSVMGDTYRALGRNAEAEAMHRKAMAIYQNLYGNEDLHVASLLNSLAVEMSDQYSHAEAESLERESLAIRRKLLGGENLAVAESLAFLAVLVLREGLDAPEILKQGKFLEAETLAREALAMRRKLLGNENLDVGQSLADLAGILHAQGKFRESESLEREALTIRTKLLGKENLPVATSLSTLADTISDQGRRGEAETFYREALAIRRKLCGNEHPDVAIVLAHLATLLQREGRLAEAEAMDREALAVWRKSLGDKHPYIARTLNILAEVLRDEGKFTESESAFREALSLRQKVLGNEHAETKESLNELNDLLQRQGKLAEAKALLESQTNSATEKKPEPH